MSMKFRIPQSIVALAALASCACGARVDGAWSDELTADDAQEIIGGTLVTTDTLGTALVRFPLPGTCTGTIFRNRWLLTASHCTTTNGVLGGPPAAPATISAQLLGGSNQPAGVAVFRHPTLDVALVRLNADPLNAAGQRVSNRLYLGNVASLASQTLLTQGWGNTAITDCIPNFAGTGAGNLRSANIRISNVSGAFFNTVPTNGSIEWTGDSGSSLYQSVNGFLRAIGVQSNGVCSEQPFPPSGVPVVNSIGHVRSDFFRDWAHGIMGSAPTAGTPAGYERSDGISTVVYPHFQSNRIRELALVSGGWRFGDLNSASGSSTVASSEVSAYIRNDSASTVVFRGNDGRVRELALTGNSWRAADLSGLGGRPVAVGARPSAYTRSDRVSTVLYRGTDSHIYELSRTSTGTWSHADLCAITGAPAAAGDPVGYVRHDAINAITYKSTSGRVIELFLNGSNWAFADLSSIVGATDAGRLVGFGPRPFSRPDSLSSVVYVDVNKRIQVMTLGPSGWTIGTTSPFTGTTTNVAVPYVRSDGIAAILYINSDSRVREAAITGLGLVTTDITAMTGAPAALNPANGFGSLLMGYVRSDNLTTVVYQSTARHVIELARFDSADPHGIWSAANLSTIVGGI